MSGTVLHKNHNLPLPNFRVIALCFYILSSSPINQQPVRMGDINLMNLLVLT